MDWEEVVKLTLQALAGLGALTGIVVGLGSLTSPERLRRRLKSNVEIMRELAAGSDERAMMQVLVSRDVAALHTRESQTSAPSTRIVLNSSFGSALAICALVVLQAPSAGWSYFIAAGVGTLYVLRVLVYREDARIEAEDERARSTAQHSEI